MPGGERDAAAKVRQAVGFDPRVQRRPAGQAVGVDLRREHLGQRRDGRFFPRRAAREVHIGVDRKAHPGAHMAMRPEVFAREAHRHAEPAPGLDAAGVAAAEIAAAVVVEDALDPAPPLRAVGAVGQHGRVLLRNVDLVVEAVRDPRTHLEGLQFAAVQALVERVVDVVLRLAVAQPGLEGRGAPRFARVRVRRGAVEEFGVHWVTSGLSACGVRLGAARRLTA